MLGRATVAVALGLVGGMGIVGVLFVRPLLDWPSAEEHTVQGRRMLDTIGRLTKVDSGSVVVAPTRLGVVGRRFSLDGDTRILVGDKEGGVGDLHIGAHVAMIYEPSPDGLVARWLGVNLDRHALRVAAQQAEGSAAVGPHLPASTNAQPEAPTRRAEEETKAAAPRPRQPTPNARGREADDPAALIDWLLRNSGRN